MPVERSLSIAALVIAIIAIIIAGIAIGYGLKKPPAVTTTIVSKYTTTIVKSVTVTPTTVTKTLTTTATSVLTTTRTVTAVTTVTKTPPLKTVTLTIEYCEPHKYMFKMAIEKFKEEAKKLGYNVIVKEIMIPYGVDCAAKVTQDLATGTAGDVIDEDSFLLASVAQAGYIIPLDQFISTWPDWKEFAPAMRDIVKWNGHVYGVMIDTDVRMIWYRKDIFKLCGLPVPWQPKDWKDILDAAAKLAACAPKIKAQFHISEFYPILIPAGLKWGEATPCQGFWMLLVGADKAPYNRLYDYEHRKWICKSDALWRSFWLYIYLQKKGWNANPVHFASDTWAAHRKYFAEGKVAMDLGGCWEFFEGWGPDGIAPLPVCKQQCKGLSDKDYDECYLKCEWNVIGWAKMPGWSGGAHGEPAYVSVSGGWFVGINAKIKNDPDKLKLAWLFIKIIASREIEAKYAAKYSKPCPRLDCSLVPEYAQSKYVKEISPLIKITTFRDALPAYPKISKVIQYITQLIIEGKLLDPDKALDMYCSKLKQIVGPNNVESLPLHKEEFLKYMGVSG